MHRACNVLPRPISSAMRSRPFCLIAKLQTSNKQKWMNSKCPQVETIIKQNKETCTLITASSGIIKLTHEMDALPPKRLTNLTFGIPYLKQCTLHLCPPIPWDRRMKTVCHSSLYVFTHCMAYTINQLNIIVPVLVTYTDGCRVLEFNCFKTTTTTTIHTILHKSALLYFMLAWYTGWLHNTVNTR